MIALRTALYDLLRGVTYVNTNGETVPINVFFETETPTGKARWPTPAIIIRGVRALTRPADIGWDNYVQTLELDLSLYMKQRSQTYDAEAVRTSVTEQVETLIRGNKTGIGGAQSLKLVSVMDRDWVEEVGILRRDFTLEAYYEEWEG